MTLPVVSFCYDTLYQTASKSCKIQAYIAYQKGPSSIAFDRFFQIATLQIKTFLSDKAKKLTQLNGTVLRKRVDYLGVKLCSKISYRILFVCLTFT